MADSAPLLAASHTGDGERALSLEQMPPLSGDEEQFLLEKYRPVVILDSGESFFPCSPEYFVVHSSLEVCRVKGEGGEKLPKEQWTYECVAETGELRPHTVGAAQLGSHDPAWKHAPRSRYVMRPHREHWAGQPAALDEVPLLGFARRLPASELHDGYSGEPIVELTYMFLFMYNGCTFVVESMELGVHEGDLEHIKVRVEEHSGRVVEVFFAAHSKEGRWVLAEDCEFFDPAEARCYVFCARHSHASAPFAGTIWRIWGLANDSCDARGLVWNAPRVVRLSYTPDEPEKTSPEWLRYRGRWGGLPALTANWWFGNYGEQPRRIRAGGQSLLETGRPPRVANPRCGLCC